MVSDRESRTAPPSSRAILRETEGLSASLLQDREEVLRWKDENPLRLVAAALVDINGRAARKDIQERIVPELVPSEDWENWWKIVQPAVRDSQSFDYHARNGTRLKGTAIPSAMESPAFSELSAASRKKSGAKKQSAPAVRIDWVTWVQSDETLAIPAGNLPPGLSEILREQPALLVPRAIARVSAGIEERVLGAKKPPKTSGDWVNALSAALSRWLELHPDAALDSAEFSIAGIVGMTRRLYAVLDKPSDCKSLFQWLADYTSADAQNAGVMANAILIASSAAPSETTTLLEEIDILLSEPDRKELWQNLITAGMRQSNGWLNNRWLSIPSDSEKAEIVSNLLMLARDADSIGDLDGLLSDMWNTPETARRAHLFNPILMGWILHRELMPKAEGVLQKFAEEIGNGNSQTPENPIMRQWQETVKAASQNEIDCLRAEHRREMDEKERLISVGESELERAGRRERHLQGELRDAAFVKGVRFNGDAIIILGQSIQWLSTSPIASHEDVTEVKDKIIFALSKLGAKPFGEVGKVVPFEPGVHEAHPSPVAGTLVKITGPGVEYIKDVDTPQMMVKIKVQVE